MCQVCATNWKWDIGFPIVICKEVIDRLGGGNGRSLVGALETKAILGLEQIVIS